jgi:hypothetical protein
MPNRTDDNTFESLSFYGTRRNQGYAGRRAKRPLPAENLTRTIPVRSSIALGGLVCAAIA